MSIPYWCACSWLRIARKSNATDFFPWSMLILRCSLEKMALLIQLWNSHWQTFSGQRHFSHRTFLSSVKCPICLRNISDLSKSPCSSERKLQRYFVSDMLLCVKWTNWEWSMLICCDAWAAIWFLNYWLRNISWRSVAVRMSHSNPTPPSWPRMNSGPLASVTFNNRIPAKRNDLHHLLQMVVVVVAPGVQEVMSRDWITLTHLPLNPVHLR